MPASRPLSFPRIFVAGAVMVGMVSLAGCGTTGAAPTTSPASRFPTGSGPVDVAYAASLENVFDATLGPAFDRATGIAFSGYPAGSTALANTIKGETRAEDVFISASPATDHQLMGAANGAWVSWYSSLAAAPLVLGYNPKSRFAADLRSRPWYQVVTEAGFLLGRTDPQLDPKGKLAVEALDDAARQESQPALGATTAGVFPEEVLVGRLQAGQLDAGFFYANEAKAAGIPTVSLSPVDLAARFTVTVLNRAPHRRAADAFVNFLYSPAGHAILDHAGLTLPSAPRVSGSTAAVPRSLRKVLKVAG